jgi:hypothetical protein
MRLFVTEHKIMWSVLTSSSNEFIFCWIAVSHRDDNEASDLLVCISVRLKGRPTCIMDPSLFSWPKSKQSGKTGRSKQ